MPREFRTHTSGSLPSGFRTQTEPPTFLTHESRFGCLLLEVGGALLVMLVDIPSIVEKVPHFGDAGRESEECHVPSKGTKLVGVRMRMETEDVQG